MANSAYNYESEGSIKRYIKSQCWFAHAFSLPVDCGIKG